MLAGPNAGLLNKLYRAWTGAEEPLVNIFSMPGLIFVVSIYTFPYVFIMIANTLELIASDLEDAASILGASRVRVALTVTLPMVLPAILSGFVLPLLQALPSSARRRSWRCPRAFTRSRPRSGRCSSTRPRSRWRRRSRFRHLDLGRVLEQRPDLGRDRDRKSTRLNSSHVRISYAVFCLKKK